MSCDFCKDQAGYTVILTDGETLINLCEKHYLIFLRINKFEFELEEIGEAGEVEGKKSKKKKEE